MTEMNPQSAAAALGSLGALARVAIFGGAAVYGVSNSLFNVEGGHRAIVFNRVFGIKEQVRRCTRRFSRSIDRSPSRTGVQRRHASDGALVREADRLRRQGATIAYPEHVGLQGPADGTRSLPS